MLDQIRVSIAGRLWSRRDDGPEPSNARCCSLKPEAEERRKHANRRELMVGLGFHLLAGDLDNKRWDVDPSRPAPGAPIEELKSRSTAIERESRVTHAVASTWQPPVRASPCTRACAPLRTTSARAPSAPPPRARWPSTCPGTAAKGAHARRRGGGNCLTAAARRWNPGAPPAAALLRQAGQQLERALGVSVCGRAAAGGRPARHVRPGGCAGRRCGTGRLQRHSVRLRPDRDRQDAYRENYAFEIVNSSSTQRPLRRH